MKTWGLLQFPRGYIAVKGTLTRPLEVVGETWSRVKEKWLGKNFSFANYFQIH